MNVLIPLFILFIIISSINSKKKKEEAKRKAQRQARAAVEADRQPYSQTAVGEQGKTSAPYVWPNAAPASFSGSGAEHTQRKRSSHHNMAGGGSVSLEARGPSVQAAPGSPTITHRMSTLTQSLAENTVPTLTAFSRAEGLGQSMPGGSGEGKGVEGEARNIPLAQQSADQKVQPAAFQKLAFDANSVISGFVYSEILGPPKAKRR